jgi:Asp-tRNA(Asn)/Glu-tRNA(Gln) amidotransferase A subunit family amidase
MLAKIPLPTMA